MTDTWTEPFIVQDSICSIDRMLTTTDRSKDLIWSLNLDSGYFNAGLLIEMTRNI